MGINFRVVLENMVVCSRSLLVSSDGMDELVKDMFKVVYSYKRSLASAMLASSETGENFEKIT